MYYLTSTPYAKGVDFDDTAFGIEWPVPVAVISDPDRNWPEYQT
jgi:dTDP-4-dehydrorhamnose 3,5-epimerase